MPACYKHAVSRHGVFVGVAVLQLVGVCACTKPNPEFCTTDQECPGQVCDLDRNTCVPGTPSPDAATDATPTGDANLPDAATSIRVQVDRTGSGEGTVVSNPAGINCGTICEAVFPIDSGVTLVAQPAVGSSFVEWTGDCAGFAPCELPSTATAAATAHFGIPGEHLWSLGAGADDVDSAFDAVYDSDGNLVVAGTFAGTINLGGEDLVSASLSRDGFVAKFAPDGTHLWSVRLGDAEDDIAYRLDAYANGDVAVALGIGVSFDFNPDPRSTAAHAVVRLAAETGAELRRLDFVTKDGALAVRDVAVDVAQNLVVAGVFQGTADIDGDVLANATGDDHGFLAWYADDGSHFRTLRLTPSTSVEVQGLEATPGGGVVVVGGLVGTLVVPIGQELDSSVDGRGFIINISSAGLNTWQQSWRGNPGRVALDSDGNAFVAGTFSSAFDFGGGMRTPVASRDIVVVGYDSAGNYLWDAVTTSDSSATFFKDTPTAVSVSRGHVAVTGIVTADADFGGGTRAGFENMTSFVADYDAATGAHRWSSTFGAESGFDAFGMGVALDPVGRVGAVGLCDGTASFGGDPIVGFAEIYVAVFGP